jgi:hypothetical protein
LSNFLSRGGINFGENFLQNSSNSVSATNEVNPKTINFWFGENTGASLDSESTDGVLGETPGAAQWDFPGSFAKKK